MKYILVIATIAPTNFSSEYASPSTTTPASDVKMTCVLASTTAWFALTSFTANANVLIVSHAKKPAFARILKVLLVYLGNPCSPQGPEFPRHKLSIQVALAGQSHQDSEFLFDFERPKNRSWIGRPQRIARDPPTNIWQKLRNGPVRTEMGDGLWTYKTWGCLYQVCCLASKKAHGREHF
jgi:hypothetical protein